MDRYSRTVALLKVALPLAALALLSTLFLLSRGTDPDATIPFSDADIAERLRDQQVTAPFFSGTTARGDAIMITAAKAKPASAGAAARTDDMTGRIDLPGGTRITLRAATGTLHPEDDRATFDGAVTIKSTRGFDLRTERLSSALNAIDVETEGAVTGTGLFGRLDAGKMRLRSKTGSADVHLLFNEGVKLIYDPKPRER
ncbi:MAG: LPS export ABC transporter periplasmic protein LptC [Rhodobacteraceae bacterium]|nr:LPS export ABC transporter periplasmic protein LptC [Paracoccaceae bacterium]